MFDVEAFLRIKQSNHLKNLHMTPNLLLLVKGGKKKKTDKEQKLQQS